MNQLFDLWNGRNDREKMIIGGGLALLLAGLLYAYLWLPMSRDAQKYGKKTPELRQDFTAFRANLAELKALGGFGAGNGVEPNLSQVFSALAGAVVARKEPGLWSVEFKEPVSFNQVIELLLNLQRQHGLKVRSMTVNKAADPSGSVTGTLTIGKPGEG